MYYNAGVQYGQSDDIKDAKKARKFLGYAKKYNPDSKDIAAALKKVKQQGASVMQNMAGDKAEEKSFEAQLEPATLYEKILLRRLQINKKAK